HIFSLQMFRMTYGLFAQSANGLTVAGAVADIGAVIYCRQTSGFESVCQLQEKRPFSNGLFSIQSEGLACNLTAGEYVIAEGVWHHASACILLRIDYIQHFVMI
ncbi:MAG: hypothetical protein II377_05810, partial [Clostridia bacterium]|nr:hypothetical protein [Clostridia bacterium]